MGFIALPLMFLPHRSLRGAHPPGLCFSASLDVRTERCGVSLIQHCGGQNEHTHAPPDHASGIYTPLLALRPASAYTQHTMQLTEMSTDEECHPITPVETSTGKGGTRLDPCSSILVGHDGGSRRLPVDPPCVPSQPHTPCLYGCVRYQGPYMHEGYWGCCVPRGVQQTVCQQGVSAPVMGVCVSRRRWDGRLPPEKRTVQERPWGTLSVNAAARRPSRGCVGHKMVRTTATHPSGMNARPENGDEAGQMAIDASPHHQRLCRRVGTFHRSGGYSGSRELAPGTAILSHLCRMREQDNV